MDINDCGKYIGVGIIVFLLLPLLFATATGNPQHIEETAVATQTRLIEHMALTIKRVAVLAAVGGPIVALVMFLYAKSYQ